MEEVVSEWILDRRKEFLLSKGLDECGRKLPLPEGIEFDEDNQCYVNLKTGKKFSIEGLRAGIYG